MMPFGDIPIGTDIDRLSQNCIYAHNQDTDQITSLPGNYGLLVNMFPNGFANGGKPNVQFFISNEAKLYVREFWVQSWSEWIEK